MADTNPDLVLTAAESAANWNPNWTSYAIKFFLVTVLLTAVLAGLFSFGNVKELTKNFPKYRCNPALMPFASAFGYDAKENFNFCLSSIFNVKAAEIFAPIYKLLSQYTEVITTIVNATLGIRQLFANFFSSVNSFISNVRNRIQNLLFKIRLSFMKITNLMGKVYGTMYAVIWMGTSALAAGTNLAENSLVKFLFEFCFDPETPIELHDGTVKTLSALEIGDQLAVVDGAVPRVTSVFRFAGSNTPMVQIGKLKVSGSHYVRYLGKWIQASAHPSAVPTESCHELVCLNVSGNKFKICDMVVRDYDEHMDAAVVSEAQQLASKCLNASASTCDVSDYSLGVDPAAQLELSDGSWKSAKEIQLGDCLKYSGAILGKVIEECEEVCELPAGGVVSSAQLMFDGGRWRRAGEHLKTRPAPPQGPQQLIQIITANCSAIHMKLCDAEYFMRDYREIADPDMETPYENAFAYY